MGVHSKKRYLIGLFGSRKNPMAPYGWHPFGTLGAKRAPKKKYKLIIRGILIIYVLFPRKAKYNPQTQKNTCKLSYNITSKRLSG